MTSFFPLCNTSAVTLLWVICVVHLIIRLWNYVTHSMIGWNQLVQPNHPASYLIYGLARELKQFLNKFLYSILLYLLLFLCYSISFIWSIFYLLPSLWEILTSKLCYIFFLGHESISFWTRLNWTSLDIDPTKNVV